MPDLDMRRDRGTSEKPKGEKYYMKDTCAGCRKGREPTCDWLLSFLCNTRSFRSSLERPGVPTL